MIATTIKTIHSNIITLLVHQGYGRVEAEKQWDTTYKRIIANATPGKHTLIIGQWSFEYEKPNIPSPVDLSDLL